MMIPNRDRIGGNQLISVVTPARNAEATLAEALDSLLAQSYPSWEAIIVDDGSTDRTAAIIERYEARDGRFSMLRGAGQGVSAARNRGLAVAQGRWVLFLDADDWIDARHLEKMSAALASHPDAYAAYCNSCRITPEGKIAEIRSFPSLARRPFAMLARSCLVAIHAILVERAVVTSVGAFDTSLQTCEDWDLWLRVARLGDRWIHVDEPLSFYRGSRDSLSKNAAQLLADGKTVIARAFAAHDRVPHAASDQGDTSALGEDGVDHAIAIFAFWCGGVDCGQGGDGTAALETLAALPPPEVGHADAPAYALFHGLMVGHCVALEQLAADWRDFGPAVTALLAKLADAWGDPIAARAIRYCLDRLILECADLTQPRRLGLTLGLKVNMRDPRPVAPSAEIDRLYILLSDGEQIKARIDLGVLGVITRRQWIERLVRDLGVGKTLVNAGMALWPSLLLRLPAYAAREIARDPKGALRRYRPLMAAAGRKAILSAAGPSRPPGSHPDRLFQLRCEAEAEACLADDMTPAAPSTTREVEGDWRTDRRSFFESWFEREDPWNYGSAYEREKYARQMQLLPEGGLGVALELACAEGRFTKQLAQHVDRLIAADISARALERARIRCRDKRNVEFRQLDLCNDPLPAAMDLIVCSEVLYFLNDEEELRDVAKRLAAALKPGGRLLTAHAFILSDDMSRTGFDWPHRFGAATIARFLAATPGLAHERSLQTEVYRIDRFIKCEEAPRSSEPAGAAPVGGEPAMATPIVAEPIVETIPLTAEIEPEVARHLLWGGAVARRSDVALTERRATAPVLVYHRIASEGPPELAACRVAPEMFRAQMTWLRRNGYHFIGSGLLHWSMTNKHPFAGRPVMISFDGGFQDFADQAWPILRVHDFSAEVFIVTDCVGKTARWNARVGGDFPLMDARTIVRLAEEGVRFGSHLASHRPADGLSTRELAAELLRSRALLRKWLGKPPQSFAAPFGLTDERLRLLAAECGFTVGFGKHPGVATPDADPLNLPRIMVHGEWTLDDFIDRMQRLL